MMTTVAILILAAVVLLVGWRICVGLGRIADRPVGVVSTTRDPQGYEVHMLAAAIMDVATAIRATHTKSVNARLVERSGRRNALKMSKALNKAIAEGGIFEPPTQQDT